jgi:hypothetical protein
VTELSRKVRKLRRRVYRDIPVATWNRVAEIDFRRPYDELRRMFESGDRGVLSGGAALALWRAVTDRGLRAWCYDFGFPESLTHMVTVVEVDGALEVHDAFFNLSYPVGFHTLLDCVRGGVAVVPEADLRDRRSYVADPAFEPEATMRWLETHTDRELTPKNGLRRFELLWDRAAFTATSADIDAAYRDLEAHGHPRDLSCLMLYPVGVFDGERHHRDRAGTPLLRDRDLSSPLATVRIQAVQANAQLAEALNETERLRSNTAQHERQLGELQAALDDAARHFDAERAARSREREHANAKLHDTIALRAKLQAELQVLRAETASLTAERDGANERLSAALAEADQLRSHVGQLRAALDDTTRQAERERRALLHERDKLSERLGQATALNDQVRAEKQQAQDGAAALQVRVKTLEQYATTLARHLADLVEQEAARNAALAQKDAALRARGELLEKILAKGRRYLGVEALAEMDAVAVLDEMRRRLRQAEVELDRAICAHDQMAAAATQRPRQTARTTILSRWRHLISQHRVELSFLPR